MAKKPTRRTWLRCALGLAAVPATAAPALAWRERALLGFGTTLWLRAGHADGAVADRALDAAVALLRHIERQMSLFDPNSALQRLNRDGMLAQPDPHLVAVLTQAQAVAARSGGTFDVTVQPLWAAWRQAQAAGRRPTADALARARALVDWRGLQVSDHEIRLARPGMALTLNGIAQGYAAEQARALLRAQGITAALLDCGEWAPVGNAPDGQPWRLGLASPRDSARLLRTLAADGRGIAVSTDATLRFGADPGDDSDHHILDPHTGRSPPHLSAVAVAAPSTTLADALTKVLFMGTADQALALARQWGVDAVVVDKAGQLRATPGWA
jgi:thiamine biosynthesis lipoprotein